MPEAPLRIAVICHGHPSVSKGGAEVAAYALYRGLRELGADAIFIATCEYADRDRLALASEREFPIYYDRDRYDYFYHLSAPAVEDQLLAILREQRITVANFHHFLLLGLNALRAALRLPGMRCFYTIHEFLAICHNHGQMVTREAQLLCTEATNEACVSCFPEMQRTQFTQRRETILEVLGGFEGFISPSRFVSERFAQWGLPGRKMTIIENGLLGAPSLSTRLPRGNSSWTFGYFGQINPYKGVDVLLDAAALIGRDSELASRIRLRIHGNLVGQPDSFIRRFERAVRRHAFLTYAGPYNTRAVYGLMGDCDYIIVPSKWWENSPVVIQEAYAMRVPVICTGIGGLAEKVREGISGLHFARGDAADLMRAIRIAADPKIAEALRAGIPAVFTAAQMAQSYLKVFDGERRLARPRVVDRER